MVLLCVPQLGPVCPLLQYYFTIEIPLAAICYDSGGPIPSLPGLFGMGQDHYGPTRDPFHIEMWQLAHVKAYIRPILPRINTGTSNYCLSFRL
jgi:hypothetical protein